MSLLVCPLRLVEATIAERRPSHLITLLSPEEMIETPPGFAAARHLRLGVHDIAFPMQGLTHPQAGLVEQILDFAVGWDATDPILIHCWAGISRSTATAFMLACERNPHADEYAIARAMKQASHTVFPNRRIVALADDVLDRRGRMVEAVEAIGGNNFEIEGVPFELAARH